MSAKAGLSEYMGLVSRAILEMEDVSFAFGNQRGAQSTASCSSSHAMVLNACGKTGPDFVTHDRECERKRTALFDWTLLARERGHHREHLGSERDLEHRRT
jgi:hypothetical protein